MTKYNADAIEVLTGLEPVRKRPGMYTDTTRPNHLAQEVIDNSVDEALAGHCSQIDVVLHGDGALTVTDDGRGMPVDLHPEQKLPGVEVILSTLHAGASSRTRAINSAAVCTVWACRWSMPCRNCWKSLSAAMGMCTPWRSPAVTRPPT